MSGPPHRAGGGLWSAALVLSLATHAGVAVAVVAAGDAAGTATRPSADAQSSQDVGVDPLDGGATVTPNVRTLPPEELIEDGGLEQTALAPFPESEPLAPEAPEAAGPAPTAPPIAPEPVAAGPGEDVASELPTPVPDAATPGPPDIAPSPEVDDAGEAVGAADELSPVSPTPVPEAPPPGQMVPEESSEVAGEADQASGTLTPTGAEVAALGTSEPGVAGTPEPSPATRIEPEIVVTSASPGQAIVSTPPTATLDPVGLDGMPVSAPGPAGPAPGALTAQDAALEALTRRVRAVPGAPCTVALPRRVGQDGVGLALVGADEIEMASLTEAIDGAAAEPLPGQTRDLIDRRQCPLLDLLSNSPAYPAMALGLVLDGSEVPSGGVLTGFVVGGRGREVLVVLVDDAGVVHDLGPFTSESGGVERFVAPVRRDETARETRQLVLALAWDGPLADVKARAGQLASEVFRDLPSGLAEGAALGLATVDIR